MKSLTFRICETLFYSSVLVLISAGQDAEQPPPEGFQKADQAVLKNLKHGKQSSASNVCQKFSGNYVKQYTGTCCQNETLFHPYHFKEFNLSQCAEELHKVDSDDFPTAMWREHLCILKIAGMKDEDLNTFKGFMEYMTSNYTEPIKTKILESMEQCSEAESEKDESKRLKMFHLCMYKSERKVCHQPYGNLNDDAVKFSAETQKYCQPDDDFPGFGTQCCKGSPTPYPTYLFRGDFGLTAPIDISKTKKCMQSFVDRQKELAPNLKKGKTCEVACKLTGSPFTSPDALKIDVEEIKKSLFAAFPSSVRNDLLLLFDKYKDVKSTKRFGVTINKNYTISFSEAVQMFTTAKNELTQIKLYCEIFQFITKGLENTAMEDYCYDEAYAKRYFQKNDPSNNVSQ